ncbi:hypothetical protein [Pseudomonas syringae]|uniref:hypothetical protein n=1 Tax=Pseudomonas syringae TaxID=317 RepID=UPI00294AC888|nr:hypothetical protein [Pseudomonas syringae]WOK32159.1 hypothetical protein RRP28_28310 [Pseudomonas syringae pv. actinidiae]
MRTTYSEPSALRCPESICSSEVLCIADACRVRPENSTSLLQIDSGHLSAEGSLYVVRNYVLPRLVNE